MTEFYFSQAYKSLIMITEVGARIKNHEFFRFCLASFIMAISGKILLFGGFVI
ncbi:hypothetical protein HMPREF9382_1563 [Streptococcus sanguinis SK115]|uniref:Uncharacterized protein n=1 Tax=Streptococcus sanguinis SK115 TaxID=888810 RepID=F0I9S9_STRSA|nr:hypothetical protein HMPREF9382_1563 [Streptococcus sanguinis SK115]